MSGVDHHDIPGISPVLKEHIDFALNHLNGAALELSEPMVKHQLKLADRQCRIAHMSQRIQDMITILVTALYAHRQKDEVITMAADILCQDLQRKLTGEEPSDQYFKAASKLADQIIAGNYAPIKDILRADIIFSYEKK